MAIISNGTTVASGGSVRGSASNLTSLPAPTTSQVLSATASASVGAVGTYGLLRHNNNSVNYDPGGTISGSSLEWTTGGGNAGGDYASGTWRCMGKKRTGGTSNFVTVWLRIS
jgi:hypothetical protein